MSAGGGRWLVTGGAGYIGSHLVRTFRAAERDVVVVDDLSSGRRNRLPSDVPFYEANVTNTELLADIMRRHEIDGVLHLAAKKSVEESMRFSLNYWNSNVTGLIRLLQAMEIAGVKNLVYSSSSAVYGASALGAVDEESVPMPTNVYGQTKLAGERIIEAHAATTGLSWIALRYFNVAGSSDPTLVDDHSLNLVPQVMSRLLNGEAPVIFGNDMPTPDGTCVRDYVHVADVADAHIAAADAVASGTCGLYNIGTGVGTSVAEIVAHAQSITGVTTPAIIRPARLGDVPSMVGIVDKIRRDLGWSASRDARTMISDELAHRLVQTPGGESPAAATSGAQS